ncbi:MAG TPA: Gfo/Idh/MocA family oxidoreductase [Bryobacteraceae bacterium]|nr:Gfo/Idh/MocA family oxidoreductase [Bryobacteraceae bacterium]
MLNRLTFLLGTGALLLCASLSAADLRLGIIGTDTSHVIAFGGALNDPAAADHLPGARITVAFKGDSPDVQESATRVEKFAAQLRDQFGVRLVDSIGALCGQVDGILLESVDGRAHLAQAKEAIRCGKPIFIDKPLGATLDDAREIARLAAAAGVPWFSASSERYAGLKALQSSPVKGAIVWGPGPYQDHMPLDLTWYGIHSAEALFALMGTGCAEVTRTATEGADVVTCRWNDGRLGSIRLDRPSGKFGALVFHPGNDSQVLPAMDAGYVPLLKVILAFMNTRRPPVANAETIEVFQFLDAAQRSKERGGAPVQLR